MPEDIRKEHILTTIANYFGLNIQDISWLSEHRALGNFLDDASCVLLSARHVQKNSVDLSNDVIC